MKLRGFVWPVKQLYVWCICRVCASKVFTEHILAVSLLHTYVVCICIVAEMACEHSEWLGFFNSVKVWRITKVCLCVQGAGGILLMVVIHC